MKNQNIYISVLVILVAIGLGVYLMHRHVDAPVLAPSDLSAPTSIGQGDDSTDTTLPSDDTTTDTGDRSFSLMCDDSKSMALTFHLPEDSSVDVVLGDGTSLTLPNTSSQDSIQYSSPDGADILAVTSTTVTLTQNNVPTYTNCVPTDTGSDDSSSDSPMMGQ